MSDTGSRKRVPCVYDRGGYQLVTKDKIINTVLQGYVVTQVETQNCIFSSNHTQKAMTL